MKFLFLSLLVLTFIVKNSWSDDSNQNLATQNMNFEPDARLSDAPSEIQERQEEEAELKIEKDDPFIENNGNGRTTNPIIYRD